MRQIFQGFFFPNKSSSSTKEAESKEFLRGNSFDYGSSSIPRRDKAKTGGEDAHIANKKLISIADGVGGWSDIGIDASLYSKELCTLIDRLYRENRQKYIKNPKSLLVDAVALNKEQGTSTSLILTIDESKPIVYASNIGDSSYMILRKVKTSTGSHLRVVFQSTEQCRSFNYPYQVGTHGDNPRIHALACSHNIKQNDIFVCGSDGLFDNLDINHILMCIMPFLEGDRIVDIKLLSEFLAKYAFELSLDPKFQSPFAKKCQSFNGDGIGGKEDDITVVIAQVNVD